MANTLRNQKVRFALIVDAWRKAKKKTMDANTLNLFNEAKRILFDDDPNEQRKAELNKLHIKLREAANKNDDKSYDRISKKITKLATQKPVDRVLTDNEHRLVEIYLDQITPDAVASRGIRHGGQASKKSQLEGVLLAIAEVKQAKPDLKNKRAAVWNYLKKLTREGKPQTIDGKYLISISGDYLKQETIHDEKKTIRKIKRSSFIKHYF
jgi:hypothetical protein